MLYRPRNFIIQELVCQHVYNQFGEMAYQFFDERLFMTIDFIRDHLGEIYVNNWDLNETQRKNMSLQLFDERGLRCVQCSLVKEAIKKHVVYCSAHLRGQALDFNVKGMKTAQVQLWILTNYAILPFPLRVEKNTNGWNHIDVCNSGKNKVELFIAKN